MSDVFFEINETDKLRIALGITGEEPEHDCDPVIRQRYLATTQTVEVKPVDIGGVDNE
jgi:hypothetical protein